MRSAVLVWILYSCFPQSIRGAGCNAYTGAVVRNYDSTTVVGSSLSANEHITTDTGMEMVFTHSDYQTSCACGIVTMWQFFAWKPGTVVFYVLDGTTVKGSFSVTIGEQSDENFFEVPVSSDLWIPIQNGNRLGFYTSGVPMMTYETVSSYTAGYYNTGRSLSTTTVSASGTTTTDRKYAVAAYITEAHSPVFINAPFTTTIYTHDTGDVIYTANVLDVDGLDTLSVTKTSGNAAFTWDTSTLKLTYSSAVSQNTYIVELSVSDGCTTATTTTITIKVINEGPTFLNLPASVTVLETDSGTTVLHTITHSDPSDSVTCHIDSTSPTTAKFDISGDDIRAVNPTYTFSSEPYYDIRIRCTDGTNDVYSNFQVDVIKNEPPIYNPGSGYLPASIFVERTSSVTIYQLDFTDPEGESVTVTSFSLTGGGSNPFSVSSSGAVSTSTTLDAEAYDLEITIRDASGATTERVLSIITSGRPDTFNAIPDFVNLPYTKHVMEHTPIGTFLFKVLYTDESPFDTFTLTKTSSNAADTYLTFDAATGIITVTGDIDFETVTSLTMDIEVDDGTDTNVATITFVIVNVNEDVTLNIASPALAADETLVRGTPVGDPGITVTDVDATDTSWYYSMDCGDDSKYFYLDTSDLLIYFAREYDMDAGLPGNATCNVTVRDEGRLYDSGLVDITINNINDHKPKFPKNIYVFFVSTTTTFFTEIVNMSATDDDSDSHGSANGLLSYRFDPVNPTEDLFQIEASGVLFARNLSTYASNYYIFAVVAEDDEGMTGTCSVTIIFSEPPEPVTTTTERTLKFTDDYKNYFWLLLLGIVLFTALTVVGFMIWIDPKVNAYISFQMIRLNGWCRRKSKVKEPKRTVGKLTVTINNKHLENDPDNALPWELLATDADVPEMNVVQEMIEERKEKKDRDYKNFDGRAVFEKGKGERPESSRATEYSTSGSDGRPDSESPKYATFMPNNEDDKESNDVPGEEAGGEDQWGNISDRQHVVYTPVVSYSGNEADWDN